VVAAVAAEAANAALDVTATLSDLVALVMTMVLQLLPMMLLPMVLLLQLLPPPLLLVDYCGRCWFDDAVAK
jgi:hypothetical protein